MMRNERPTIFLQREWYGEELGRSIWSINSGIGSQSTCSEKADLCLRFFQGGGERGHEFENVTDDAIIGNFKNRRVLIFVDGHDGARPLHSHHVLNRAADAQRQIKFRGHGLAGT